MHTEFKVNLKQCDLFIDFSYLLKATLRLGQRRLVHSIACTFYSLWQHYAHMTLWGRACSLDSINCWSFKFNIQGKGELWCPIKVRTEFVSTLKHLSLSADFASIFIDNWGASKSRKTDSEFCIHAKTFQNLYKPHLLMSSHLPSYFQHTLLL